MPSAVELVKDGTYRGLRVEEKKECELAKFAERLEVKGKR